MAQSKQTGPPPGITLDPEPQGPPPGVTLDPEDNAAAANSTAPGLLDPRGGWNLGDLLRGAGAGLKDLFVHPLQTGAAMAQPFVASGVAPNGMYPTTAATGRPEDSAANRAVQLEAQEGQAEQGASIKANPAYAIGSIAGPVALTAGAAKIVPALADVVPEVARGNPDEAALRGLRVGSNSPQTLSTLRAVRTARPFLHGAQSLEDLQARIPGAKAEVWGPYQQTVDAISGKSVMGPDGPTTVRELEDQRQQLSALNRELKSRNPEAIELAKQKGMTQAQLLDQEKAVQRALDPHLQAAGIDPKAIRNTFGSIARVGERVSGKSTLAEEKQRYGFGKIANLSLERPLQAPAQIASGLRDLVAGRPLWSGKATDINIGEAFRNAGPKPDFGAYKPGPPPVAPLGLPSEAIGNAPFGEDFTSGGFPGRGVRTGYSPSYPQLPASASEPGTAVPNLLSAKQPPSVPFKYLRDLLPTGPSISAQPEILPPTSGFTIDADGNVVRNPRGFLRDLGAAH